MGSSPTEATLWLFACFCSLGLFGKTVLHVNPVRSELSLCLVITPVGLISLWEHGFVNTSQTIVVIVLVDLWICKPLRFHGWAVTFVVSCFIAIVALNVSFVVAFFVKPHDFSLVGCCLDNVMCLNGFVKYFVKLFLLSRQVQTH